MTKTTHVYVPDIPDLCIESIVRALAHEHPLIIAQCAANLALTSKAFYAHAGLLWDILDPGCVRLLADRRQKQIEEQGAMMIELECDWDAVAVNVDVQSKVKDIKEVCKKLGCPCSGTKTKLLDNIQDAITHKSIRKKHIRSILGVPVFSYWKCPVHEDIRNWVAAHKPEGFYCWPLSSQSLFVLLKGT
jgi:hypothetical protein